MTGHSIQPTPGMRRYCDELGYGERFTLNRAWTMPSGFDPERMEAAIRTVEQSCEDLRLRIEVANGRIREVKASEGPGFVVERVDLRRHRDAKQALEAALLEGQRREALDGRTPLYSMRFLRTGEGVTVHLCAKHLATDDRAISNLVTRLNDAYGDPDKEQAGPMATLRDWSARLASHAAGGEIQSPPRIRPLPRHEAGAEEAAAQRAAGCHYGGMHADGAFRDFHVTAGGPPEAAARNLRAAMRMLPSSAVQDLQALRVARGVDFDICAQAIAHAWKEAFGAGDLHADIVRSMRRSVLGNISDGLFMASEHLPQFLSAGSIGIKDLMRQKAERRSTAPGWIEWRARRQEALSAGVATEAWPGPDIVVNYRLESDRAQCGLLGAPRSDAFIIENHNSGRRRFDLGFWLEILTFPEGIAFIIEWQPHVADHGSSNSLLDAIAKNVGAFAADAMQELSGR